MHYIQFKDGIPVEVHKFQNLSDYQSNFYVWIPPKTEFCYEYQNSKRSEKIYAFLFQLSNQEKQDCVIKNGRMPDRLESAIITLELIFEKERREYGELIRKALKSRAAYSLVTDHGVFDDRAVSGRYTCKHDITLGDSESVIASTFVDAIADKLEGTHTERLTQALATNVLGEYMYAKTPSWYTDAVKRYGAKDE